MAPEEPLPEMPGKMDEVAMFYAPDRKSWREWLERNAASSRGVWLVLFKKATGRPSVSYKDAVEEALAFGWIDSRGRRLDAERTKLMMSPRRPGSPWAMVNKQRVERMMERGLMAPAGLEKVAAAKKDGSWSVLDGIEELRFPADLEKALAVNRKARRFLEGSGRTYLRLALRWIVTAKRPETRARRVAQVVKLAGKGRKVDQLGG